MPADDDRTRSNQSSQTGGERSQLPLPPVGEESTGGSRVFIALLSSLFILVSVLTIRELYTDRVEWTYNVIQAVAGGCNCHQNEQNEQEGCRGLCRIEQPQPMSIGPLAIKTGNPILFLYVPFAIVVGLTIWFRFESLGRWWKFALGITFVTTLLYSVGQFIGQLNVLRSAGTLDTSGLIYDTFVKLSFSEGKEVQIISVDDPHVVTLLVSLLGLVLILDRPLLGSWLRLLKKRLLR